MSRSVASFSSSLVFAALLCVCSPAWAILPGIGGWEVGDSTPAMVGMGAISALNVGTAIANMVFIGQGEPARKTAIVSYVGGAAGAITGALAFATDSAQLRAMGAVSVGLAAVTMALATWNLSLSPTQERQLAISPSSVADTQGRLAPAIALGGSF